MHFKNEMIRTGLMLLLLLAFTATSFAQTRLLTLEEAIRLGMEHSRQLKVSGTKLDISRAKTKQIWATQVPTVTLNSGYSRLSDNITPFTIKIPKDGNLVEETLNPQILNQFTNRVSAQQVIFSGLRAKHFFESTEILEKAAVLDFEKDKIEIKINIVAAVLNLYKFQQTRRNLAENLKVLQGRRTDTQNFVAQGTALENDLLKVDLAVTQLETAQRELDNGILAAQFALSTLLGLPETTEISLDETTLFSNPTPMDLSGYLAAANSSRADLAAIDQRRLASAKMLQVAKGAYLPVITANANAYYNNPNQRVFPQTDAFKGTWDIGLSLSWNLSSLYSNKFQVQEAQVTAAQLGFQKEQLAEGVRTEVANAYYNYQTALDKIGLSAKSVTQATENSRVVKNRYDAQVAPLTDLLDADFLLFQNQINAITAKTDAETAYFKLLKAIGQ